MQNIFTNNFFSKDNEGDNNYESNGGGGNSELINQSNLLKKLQDQLSSTFSNISSSNRNNKQQEQNNSKHGKYFNQESEEDVYEDQFQNPQFLNIEAQKSIKSQQNHNNNNLNISTNDQNRTEVAQTCNKSQVVQNAIQNQQNQIKLFQTHLQSFGDLLPMSNNSSRIQSHHGSQKSLQETNQQRQIANNMNGQQVYNNQSFANIIQNNHQSDNVKLNSHLEMSSPIFSQKSTNLSVHSQLNNNISSGMNRSFINESSILQIENNEKLQLQVSVQTKGLIRQFYHELTLYPSNEQKRQILLQDKPKLLISLRNSMEGLLKVLIWRLDNVITPSEFTQIYQEWQRKRDIHSALLNTSSYSIPNNTDTSISLDEQNCLWELLQKYLRDASNLDITLPKMLELLNSELNTQLLSSKCLGIDSVGKQIQPVSQIWIEEVEGLFQLLDDEQCGCLCSDRIQYFLMALLLNEIKSHNREDMIILVQKQTDAIMEHMFHTFGYVSLRNFKQYLLIQRLRRDNEIVTLKKNVRLIQKYWFKAKRSQSYSQHPVMRLYLSKFPQTLLQSIILALNDKNFEIFILELNSKAFYSSNIQSPKIQDQNNSQLLKLVKFYLDYFFEIGTQYSYLEGTLVIKESIDQFSAKLFEKFINDCKSEVQMIIKNINTFREIFVKAIKEYSKLNNQAITDIIDQHLLLESETEQTQQATTTETNIIDSYQTQTSPPRKPNLTSISSQNRLADEVEQNNKQQININRRISQLPPKYQQNPQNLHISNNFSPKDINSINFKNHTTIQNHKQAISMQSTQNKQVRKSSATPVQQQNDNQLPTFSLNLSQLSQQKQNVFHQKNASNLMITKHNQNGNSNSYRQSHSKSQERQQQNIENYGNYQDQNINSQIKSHNSSIASSQIPFVSATQAVQESFNSHYSLNDSVNQNLYGDEQFHQHNPLYTYRNNGNSHITPMKLSLRQQIEQQQQVLESMKKQNYDKQQALISHDKKLYQYSSQKNTNSNQRDNQGQSIMYNDQQQNFIKFDRFTPNKYAQNVIVQTQLSAVPHKNQISQVKSNGNISQRQSQNFGVGALNSHRRSSQQPHQQNITPRTHTPNQNKQKDSVYSKGFEVPHNNQRRLSQNDNQNISMIVQSNHNNQTQKQSLENLNSKKSPVNISPLPQFQNPSSRRNTKSPLTSANNLLNNPNFIQNQSQINQGTSGIGIKNNASSNKSSQINYNINKSQSSGSNNFMINNQSSINDKSPIRSRRVENYEEVINRLMQLSVNKVNTKKQ
eukprot:403331582